jgi:iron complex outermembrane receptor protein
VFHKDISDFIGGIARPETVLFATQAGATLTADLLITRPQNIGDATISGVEFGGSYKLDSASASPPAPPSRTPKPTIQRHAGQRQPQACKGVSDTSYSISPFFERGPFEIHFSYTYRSDFTANGNISRDRTP